MSLENLASKYIISTERVLKQIKQRGNPLIVTKEAVSNILTYVNNYLQDAKYYKAQKKLETSLTSIAYCEGLLDALKLLGAVEFEWSTKTKRTK
jgi:FAD synthetase